MTPSPELASALHHVRFWLDYHELTTPESGTYEPLDGARATFRAGGHALVLRFHANPAADGPMCRFSLELDGDAIAFDDRSANAAVRRFALRWVELEAIARCAALRDRQPHPGAAVALLARFTPICVGDDADRAHALIDASLRAWDVPELAIAKIIADVDRRALGYRWDLGNGSWALMQHETSYYIPAADVEPAMTWRRGRDFPDDELAALVAAADADSELAAAPLRNERSRMLAREIIEGDLEAAPVLADWLRESGCAHASLVDALVDAREHAAIAWAAEALAGGGKLASPTTRFDPMACRFHVFLADGNGNVVGGAAAARAAITRANLGRWRRDDSGWLDTAPGDRTALARHVIQVARDAGAKLVAISWYADGRWHELP